MKELQFVIYKYAKFSPADLAVKFWTRSEFVHTGFIYDYPTTIEPIGKTLFTLHWDYYSLTRQKHKRTAEIWSKYVPTDIYNTVKEFFEELARKQWPYDWKGILGFVIKVSDNKNKYFCSEGCAISLVRAGLWPKIKTEIVHPGSFRELLKVSGFKLKETIETPLVFDK